MKTVKLLTEARKKLSLSSDAELGKKLGVSHATVGHWRTGMRVPDATQSAKLAVLLELPPLEVIAAMESARSKRAAENKQFWKKQVPNDREFIDCLMKINQTQD